MNAQLTKTLNVDLTKGKDTCVKTTYHVKDGEAKIIKREIMKDN